MVWREVLLAYPAFSLVGVASQAPHPYHLKDSVQDVLEYLLTHNVLVVVRPANEDWAEVSYDLLCFRLLVGVQPHLQFSQE